MNKKIDAFNNNKIKVPFVVPTINPASYSNGDGEFSQMTGFVRSMVGDTASISVSYYDGLVVNELSIGIILE